MPEVVTTDTYNIEVREAGVWTTYDVTDNLTDALLLAPAIVQTVREEWMQIVMPDGTIL
jgi:hypothetical protein